MTENIGNEKKNTPMKLYPNGDKLMFIFAANMSLHSLKKIICIQDAF